MNWIPCHAWLKWPVDTEVSNNDTNGTCRNFQSSWTWCIETLWHQKEPADFFTTWVAEERGKKLEKTQKREECAKERRMYMTYSNPSTVGHVVVRVEPPPPTASSWVGERRYY